MLAPSYGKSMPGRLASLTRNTTFVSWFPMQLVSGISPLQHLFAICLTCFVSFSLLAVSSVSLQLAINRLVIV